MNLLLDFDGRRLQGVRPFAVFESKNGAWRWHANSAFPFKNGSGDILCEIRRALRHIGSNPGMARGGAVGFFAYDFARQLEPRAFAEKSAPDTLQIPDARLVFCEEISAQTISCAAVGSTPKAAPTEVSQKSSSQKSSSRKPANAPADYQNAIAQIQDFIARGDIYQANYAQQFSRELPCSPAQLYERLQKIHRAPFCALLEWDDFAIVSHSPERFLKLENRTLWAQPIKGTAPRGSTPEADAALKIELLRSEKNRAENVMIVDLLRNDFGRVCEYGTIAVPQLFEVQTFPTLHHLVSTVTGVLRADCDGLSAFAAAFPCGSITGAPKIRAMQIIDELENARRGASFGAIGYFGFDGNMEWNVAIRTITCKGNRAFFHAGGGIVEGSETQSEYAEMQLKARALLNALENDNANAPAVAR
jgi:para-aminobenzoate synthetase component 1